MSKHTPGPWRRTNLTVHTADGLAIARVLEAGIETEAAIDVFQATANAQLIAKAPEMYALLERIVDESSVDEDEAIAIFDSIIRDAQKLFKEINAP